MAVIHWVGGASFDFANPANWNPPQVPAAGDSAIIDAAGSYTVTSAASETVQTLSILGNATLSITGGTFTVNNGTGAGALAGKVIVGNSANLSIGGTIVNSGTISENSAGTTTQILLNQTTDTLTGGGSIILSANTNNLIYATTATFTLVNLNNTISGAGNIGNGAMVLSNAGIIDADQATAALTVNTAGNIILNSGTMEATGGANLNILSAVNNIGGTIEAAGAGSIVFLQANVTGGSVLATGGGVVQTSGGSGVLDGLALHPVTNGSAIQVLNGQQLTLLGSIVNNSAIDLNANANLTNLRIGSPIVTLTGTGAIHLTNNPNNQIFGNNGNFQLVNQTNTIDGAGSLGAAQMTFINAATVNANQPTALVLNTSGNITHNTGTLEATNTGGLLIQNTRVQNNGGTVQALGTGAHVDLSASFIMGGTLNSSGGGVVQTVGGNGWLDGVTYGALTNKGTVLVNDQTQLSLAGVINNTGLISDDQVSGSGSTQIRVYGQSVTLQGGGQLTLSNNQSNLVYSNNAASQFVNLDNTISGAGQLGDSQMTFVNRSAGVVNANQAAGLLQSGLLTLNTNGDISANQGLIESTNTGGLLILNTAINNTGGTISSAGAGAHTDLSASDIMGGTLKTSGGGTIDTTGNSTLDGITDGALSNTGTFVVNEQTQLSLAGTINNTGTIQEDQLSSAGSTQIRLASQWVTLTGGGQLQMSNAANNEIYGNSATFTLTNVNNIISGAGLLGDGQMTFINQAAGQVIGTQKTPLVLDTNGSFTTNTGTLGDTGVGGLVISSTTVINALSGSQGLIGATGAVGHVDLQSAYIEGGQLATGAGAVIDTVDRGSSLDGITDGVLTNAGSLVVEDGTSLSMVGTINNTGTVTMASLGSVTALRITGWTTTLQGGGQLQLSNNANNQIYATNSAFKFVNVNNTISGAGQLGDTNAMTLVNQTQGIIDANQKAALVLNVGGGIVDNTGLLTATGTVAVNGGLVIQNTTVNNAGGTISAVGPLAHVDLDGGYVEGGLLTTSGGALIQTVSSGALDGITSGAVTNTGTVFVNDHTTLTLYGTIDNLGTIDEDAASVSGATNIRLGGPAVTLAGTGDVVLSDNANNLIYGNGAPFELINQGNTISGAGQFGNTQMEFLNSSGTIAGTGTNPLVFNLGAGNGVNAAGGSIIGQGVGGVVFAAGIFTNNGTLTANDRSFVTYESGVINTNLAEGDLVGGTWVANAAGHGATLSITGGQVLTDAASITLSGAGSVIQAGNGSSFTPIEQTLSKIYTTGTLQVLANRGFSGTTSLADNGVIKLGGGTFLENSLSIATTGKFVGFGTVQDAVANAGKIEANGGLLKVTGAVTGTGTLQIDAGATLELGGTTAETVAFAAGAVGDLKLDTAKNFTGNITGAALGDIIDLANVAPASITGISWLTGPLILKNGATTIVSYPSITGPGISATADNWIATSDGGGGTDLTLTAGASTSSFPGGSSAQGASSPILNKAPAFDPAWVGGSGTSFNTAANWNPATVPVAGMAAVIGAGFSVNSAVSNTVDTLAIAATSTLNVTGGTFTVNSGSGAGGLAGVINVANATALSLGGTIVNSGGINENAAGAATQIVFNQLANSLTGGGTITLSNDSHNEIFGSTASTLLDNTNNTIVGAGDLGNGQMILSNEGTIDANQAATPLVVNTGGNPIANAGTMEATNGAELNILSPVNNAGGTIAAVGAGSLVFLQTSVSGGTVTESGGGVVTSSGGNGALDGLGLHPVTIASPIQVADNSELSLYGTIINNSAINLNSTGDNTKLNIGSPIVTLQGAGTITLTNSPNNEIYSVPNGAFQLVNQGNTITGAGQLGSAQLTFLNAGLVDASQTDALVLDTAPNYVVNTGTMQSSNTGGLEVLNTAIDNAGGTIQALVAGSHVDLSGGTVWGGTLATANGGVIQTVGGNGGLDGITFGPLVNSGTVLVNDLTQLTLAGTIVNSGTILEQQISTNGNTKIILASQSVILSGSGHLVLSNSGGNEIYGSNASLQLINLNNTISGAGQLGDGQMTLTNGLAGTIDADQSATFFQSGQLVVNTNGNLMINAGTMEATNIGGLLISNTVVQNSGTSASRDSGTLTPGLILAAGAGAHVDLDASTIMGGKLATTGGGVIQTVSNSGIDGITFGTLANTGTLLVNDLTQLSADGVINNTGTIQLDQVSAGGSTQLRVANQLLTLTGAGTLSLSDNINNEVYGNSATNTLLNVNNTILGSGQLGDGQMTFVNGAAGTVDANQSVALVLNTNGQIATNGGTLEGTGTGGLDIYSTTLINTGGTIEAVGAGARVDLQSAYIEGGLLTTATGGIIDTVDRGSVLDGITEGVLTNAGTLQVNDETSLGLVGVITNSGTIFEDAISNNAATVIRIVGATRLTGGGQVVLSSNGNNQLYGTASTVTLVNTNNTISGGGQFGDGNAMLFTNSPAGIIDATAKAALVVNMGGSLLTNTGTLESTGTKVLNGGLQINNTAINNAGGTIQALGGLAHVDLVNGAYIEGGSLISTGGGAIQTLDRSATLDGITEGTLTTSALIVVNDTTSLTLAGNINNSGTILENAFSANSNTDLRISGQVVLLGTGKVQMTDNPNNLVVGTDSTGLLINQGNTISGAGQFGNGGLSFTNTSGTIQATGKNALVMALGSGIGANGTGGSIIASGAGGLVLSTGIFTNNGYMSVTDGSTLTFQSTATNTNLTEGSLVGGIWGATAAGHGATMSLTGGAITTDAATLVLSGSGSVIQAGNGTTFTPIEQTLGTIAASGLLEILGGRNYSSSQGLTDGGAIQLKGGTFQANSLAITNTGSLIYFGTVNDAVANAGTLYASGGTLAVTGPVTGTGALLAGTGATLALKAGSNSAGSAYSNGVISLAAGVSLDVTGSVNPLSHGIFQLNAASLLEVAADTGATASMQFLAASELLVDHAAQFGTNVGQATYAGPLLQDFGVGDKVVLNDIVPTGLTPSYTPATGLLQILSGATSVATLHFDNTTLGAGTFHVANDGSGHTLITHS